jgi:hypothetical protein
MAQPGRRVTPGELRRHKEQWLRLCQEKPEMLVAAQPPAERSFLYKKSEQGDLTAAQVRVLARVVREEFR